MTTLEQVTGELQGLKELDVAVTDNMFAYARNHEVELEAMRTNGMKVHEITDHVMLMGR